MLDDPDEEAPKAYPLRDVWVVFFAALASRAAVVTLALAADAFVDDYDTSARYDLPNTSSGCKLSDGDDKVLQARSLAPLRGWR
jgi:hypothetical protein